MKCECLSVRPLQVCQCVLVGVSRCCLSVPCSLNRAPHCRLETINYLEQRSSESSLSTPSRIVWKAICWEFPVFRLRVQRVFWCLCVLVAASERAGTPPGGGGDTPEQCSQTSSREQYTICVWCEDKGGWCAGQRRRQARGSAWAWPARCPAVYSVLCTQSGYTILYFK